MKLLRVNAAESSCPSQFIASLPSEKDQVPILLVGRASVWVALRARWQVELAAGTVACVGDSASH